MSDSIALILSGHNQETALREVIHICLGVNIFLSEVTSEDSFVIPEDNFVLSEVKKNNDIITVKTIVSFRNLCGNETYCHNIDADKTENQNMTNAVKTGFYRLFTSLSGKTLPWGSQTGIRPALLSLKLLSKGFAAEECVSSLMNEYSISREKAALATEVAIRETEILKNYPKKGVSIYIGIPFCPTRCLYCSFVSLPLSKQKNTLLPYVDALCREVEMTGKLLKDKNIPIDSIYIGGGTPTSLDEDSLKKLLSAIKSSFDFSSLYEYTIEAGRADTITEGKLLAIKQLTPQNVRISINPQSLNNSVLTAIGRNHSAEDFFAVFSMAKAMGFKNINCDVIAGLPTETVEMFLNSLEKLCQLSPENITVHTMCIKRAAALKNSVTAYTSPEDAFKMVSEGSALLRNSGYLPYYMYRQKDTLGGLENTGFAKEGSEGIYNIYMMEDISTVIGLGAGAVSKIIDSSTGRIDRVYNYKDPWEYVKNFEEIIKRKSFINNL